MGILAQIAPASHRCKFGEMLDKHADPDDLATVADPNVLHQDIADVANKHWGPVSATIIGRHRRGACTCHRGGKN